MTFNACFFHSPLHWIRLETALGDFEAVSYDKTKLNIILCRLGFTNYIFRNLICSFCRRKHNEKISIVLNKKTILLLEITELFTKYYKLWDTIWAIMKLQYFYSRMDSSKIFDRASNSVHIQKVSSMNAKIN